jgi:hypothetical protein
LESKEAGLVNNNSPRNWNSVFSFSGLRGRSQFEEGSEFGSLVAFTAAAYYRDGLRALGQATQLNLRFHNGV